MRQKNMLTSASSTPGRLPGRNGRHDGAGFGASLPDDDSYPHPLVANEAAYEVGRSAERMSTTWA